MKQFNKDASFLAKDLLGLLDANAITKDQTSRVTSGIFDIDKNIGGWQKGDLIILGSRPAVGKTALATKFALEAAKDGFAVAFFSLEMSAEQMFTRIIAAESGVDYSKLRKNKLTPREQYQVVHATRSTGCLEERLIIGEGFSSVQTIQIECEKLKKDKRLDLVIIDYLQLMGSSELDEKQSFDEIAKNLKTMAKTLDVPVILLSQATKITESQNGEALAGPFIDIADVVLHVRHAKDAEEIEVVIAKNRHGAIGNVEVRFNANTLSFSEIES